MNDQVGIGTSTFQRGRYKQLLVDSASDTGAGLGVRGTLNPPGLSPELLPWTLPKTYPIDPACAAGIRRWRNYPQAQDLVCSGRQLGFHFYIENATANGRRLLGIVSTNPGLILGGADVGDSGLYDSSGKRLVALAGRVATKVSVENGPIAREIN